MTREEAIQEIKDASDSEVKHGDTVYHYDEVMKRVVAFGMAIKSFEAWEKVKTEIVERTKYLDEHDKEDMRELVGILSILASINEHLQEVTTDADCD